MLNALPPPICDEDQPIPSLPTVKNSSKTTPQTSSTGLFIPYTLNKKQQQKKSSTKQSIGQTTDKNIEDNDDDDNDNQTDFLGLTKSDQVQITNTDIESVLRETLPKSKATIIEEPPLPKSSNEFEDLDDDQPVQNQPMDEFDDEVSHLLDIFFCFFTCF